MESDRQRRCGVGASVEIGRPKSLRMRVAPPSTARRFWDGLIDKGGRWGKFAHPQSLLAAANVMHGAIMPSLNVICI